ncbi:YmfL family putative regulatory protein [Pseudomonas sp. UBA4194]|uniref:YmfL family putative regulatory protein n=1 Tax=Pseudomonas sp. UBA4194 TaxID=1947317 RepID=UPI0025EF623C|nr:YmfL family putative regulatory protein [Pseudomonas sp. UBA4194]
MKRTVLETRRQVVSAVICAYPGGRECAAARLGLPLKKFDNHAYESAGSRPLTDEQIRLLEQDAGTTHLVDYVSGLYGGVFAPLADPEQMDNVDLYARAVNTAVKRGAVDAIIAEALKDGVIDEAEIQRILQAHRAHVAARHEEITAVIILHRN